MPDTIFNQMRGRSTLLLYYVALSLCAPGLRHCNALKAITTRSAQGNHHCLEPWIALSLVVLKAIIGSILEVWSLENTIDVVRANWLKYIHNWRKYIQWISKLLLPRYAQIAHAHPVKSAILCSTNGLFSTFSCQNRYAAGRNKLFTVLVDKTHRLLLHFTAKECLRCRHGWMRISW